MKKILFIMPTMGGGGAEKSLITILRNFDYARYEVSLLLAHELGVLMDEIPAEVKVISAFGKTVSLCEKIAYNLSNKFHLHFFERWFIRRKIPFGFDTIISFCEGRALKMHGYICDKGKRNISWVHTDLVKNHYTIGAYLTEHQERKLYRKMDEIVVVSEQAHNAFVSLFPFSTNKSQVIRNLFEKDHIWEMSQAPCEHINRFVFCCVGGLRYVKGFDRMIQVAAKLKKDDRKFLVRIVGEGQERANLEQLIADLNVHDEVKLEGFSKNPYCYMRESDCFVLSSRVEGYPIVLGEVMVLGKPIIACECTGSVEMLVGGKYGVLVSQGVESLFEACCTMMDDISYRSRYATLAAEGSKLFDSDKILNQIYKVITL